MLGRTGMVVSYNMISCMLLLHCMYVHDLVSIVMTNLSRADVSVSPSHMGNVK